MLGRLVLLMAASACTPSDGRTIQMGHQNKTARKRYEGRTIQMCGQNKAAKTHDNGIQCVAGGCLAFFLYRPTTVIELSINNWKNKRNDKHSVSLPPKKTIKECRPNGPSMRWMMRVVNVNVKRLQKPSQRLACVRRVRTRKNDGWRHRTRCGTGLLWSEHTCDKPSVWSLLLSVPAKWWDNKCGTARSMFMAQSFSS